MSITELLRKILVILIQLVIRILERQIHLKMSLILTLPYIIIQCIHGKTTVLFSKTIMLVPIGSSQILWAKIQDMQNTISKYWLKIIIFQLYLHIQNFRRHRFQCLRFFLMNARNQQVFLSQTQTLHAMDGCIRLIVTSFLIETEIRLVNGWLLLSLIAIMQLEQLQLLLIHPTQRSIHWLKWQITYLIGQLQQEAVLSQHVNLETVVVVQLILEPIFQ